MTIKTVFILLGILAVFAAILWVLINDPLKPEERDQQERDTIEDLKRRADAARGNE